MLSVYWIKTSSFNNLNSFTLFVRSLTFHGVNIFVSALHSSPLSSLNTFYIYKFQQLKLSQRYCGLIMIPEFDNGTIYQQALQYWAQSTNSMKVRTEIWQTSCDSNIWVSAHHANAAMQTVLEELQHRHTSTHNKNTASVMPMDLVTDLRVIDVGGTRATYKIQNKGSVLSAYRRNITQNQTPKAQQQEQNRGMENKADGRRETKPLFWSTNKDEQSICCW